MFLFNGVLFPVYMVLNAQSWKQLWKSSDVTLLSTFAVFSFICSKVSNPVSYTHLDVYKRQVCVCVCVCVSSQFQIFAFIAIYSEDIYVLNCFIYWSILFLVFHYKSCIRALANIEYVTQYAYLFNMLIVVPHKFLKIKTKTLIFSPSENYWHFQTPYVGIIKFYPNRKPSAVEPSALVHCTIWFGIRCCHR